MLASVGCPFGAGELGPSQAQFSCTTGAFACHDPPSPFNRRWIRVEGWPAWPDVVAGLGLLSQGFIVGILSNVDDDLLSRTQIWPLVDHKYAFTSERLGWYKPDPRIYRLTAAACHLRTHVAASARDVRGACEAGIPVVRVVRTGHQSITVGRYRR